MKELRFLLLVMAICLASGVKAQFYDGPDEIYYYVEEYYEYERSYIDYKSVYGPQLVYTGQWIRKDPRKNEEKVLVFNFDGMKAAELSGLLDGERAYAVKSNLQRNPSYYEERVETTNYNWEYESSLSGTSYKHPSLRSSNYTFSYDRNELTVEGHNGHSINKYKRVDKSYFKVGRSRTPSSTLHE